MIDTGYNLYRSWLEQNASLLELTSPASLRRLTLHLFLGKNYRIVTEENTRGKLFLTYAWLIGVYNRAREQYGGNWRQELLRQLLDRNSAEERDLTHWLVGFTRKTAHNNDIPLQDFPRFLTETIQYLNALFADNALSGSEDQSWLLLMSGAATLNIRGSQKSLVGKALERVFLKAGLTILGLQLDQDFWTAIPGDTEVVRETDAEVLTRRGRIRIDMGLIAEGNPEVISDKIGRVGRRGVVIYDKIGARARVVYQHAEQSGVKLIQIRHNQPLVELYRHLSPILARQLSPPPEEEDALQALVDNLPDAIFEIGTS